MGSTMRTIIALSEEPAIVTTAAIQEISNQKTDVLNSLLYAGVLPMTFNAIKDQLSLLPVQGISGNLIVASQKILDSATEKWKDWTVLAGENRVGKIPLDQAVSYLNTQNISLVLGVQTFSDGEMRTVSLCPMLVYYPADIKQKARFKKITPQEFAGYTRDLPSMLQAQ